jgi:hypothetical protein
VKPVTVSVEVPNPPHQVYEFLEVLGNHESFMDHFMVDWQLSGPRRGVGAKANVRVKATAEKDWTDVELVEADSGRRLVEGGTGGPRGERLMGPLNRAYVKRVNGKAMRRLAERLTALPGST